MYPISLPTRHTIILHSKAQPISSTVKRTNLFEITMQKSSLFCSQNLICLLSLILASNLIQAVPSPNQRVPRQDDGEVDAITAIQQSENSVQTLQNVGNLIAHIFTQLGQVPVAILTGVGVIPTTKAPEKKQNATVAGAPTTAAPVQAINYNQVAQPQQQQIYLQQQQQPQQIYVQQPQPQQVYQLQPAPAAPQPQVNEAPEGGGGEDSGDNEDDN